MRITNFTAASLAVAFGLSFLPAGVSHAADWSLFGKSVTLSGKTKIETRNVSGFTGIALGMSGMVEIEQGSSEGVTIETDENILPHIQTVVDRGTLKIRWDANTRVDSHNLRIKITVRAININSLAVGGSGSLYAPRLQTTNLDASIGGSGDIRIDALSAKKLVTAIGGSGSFTASGTADAFDVSIGGSGRVRCGSLATGRVSVSVGGSGSTVVWAREALDVSLAGSGSVDYYGDPKVSASTVGSGRVKRLGSQP